MAVRPVLHLPAPVLQQRAAEVDAFDAEVQALIVDLVDTMRASPACVGLAANQIGVACRVFVIDVTGHRKARSCGGEIVLVNPTIVEASDPVSAREGCMSVPDLTANVARADRVVVHGRTPAGEGLAIETNAFEARALQHEIDHLDGFLILDRVASLATDVFRRKVY